jgi:hypothetical protein
MPQFNATATGISLTSGTVAQIGGTSKGTWTTANSTGIWSEGANGWTPSVAGIYLVTANINATSGIAYSNLQITLNGTGVMSGRMATITAQYLSTSAIVYNYSAQPLGYIVNAGLTSTAYTGAFQAIMIEPL